MGESALRAHNMEMKSDFKLLLKLGNYSDELLQRALKQASKRESPVAVEVLVAAPYNVRHEHDDAFAHGIVQEMLKPDEETVVDVGKTFETKRQKLSHKGEGAEEAK